MTLPFESYSINELSVAERILLVQRIWDSIAEEEDAVPLTDAQRAELDRRLDAYANNPGGSMSWEEVVAELRSRSR